MSLNAYWVYILECSNNTFYTGYTNHLIKRYRDHLKGVASKYTRSFKPIGMAQVWVVSDKSSAMRLEFFIKKQSREFKEKIILNPFGLIDVLDSGLGRAKVVQ